MASSNYDSTGSQAVTAVTDVINDHLMSRTVLATLLKETRGDTSQISAQLDLSVTDTINAGTDVAIYSSGGDIDLSGLASGVVKSLNALIFSTTDDVNLTLPKQFKGAVVLGGGDDVLNAGTSSKALDITSGAGDDSITTGSGSDTVKGGDGNDTISTGAGKDNVSGGTGNDSIDTGAGNDTITAGPGNDTINAGVGKDTIVIVNNDGTTVVDGGDGKDTLDLRGAGVIEEVHQHEVNGPVMFHFANGSTVTVSNVETFIGDFDGDGAADSINLVGLIDIYTTGS